MPKKSPVNFPQRGDIFLVNFDPTISSEIKKTRPALIIQNDVANQYSPITIVAAITSRHDERLYPAKEGGLNTDSILLLDQIRSIDKQRLIRQVGQVKPGTMAQVDSALQISLGLVEI